MINNEEYCLKVIEAQINDLNAEAMLLKKKIEQETLVAEEYRATLHKTHEIVTVINKNTVNLSTVIVNEENQLSTKFT